MSEQESETIRIADQLVRAFDGEAWHGDALLEILAGVSGKQAAAKAVRSAHSIWELVLHIAAWDRAVLRRINGSVVELSDEENFPSISDTSEAAWQKAQSAMKNAHQELIDAVRALPEGRLSEMVPGKQGAHYNFYYMLHGVVQHELYHAGQIALLKKLST